MANKKQPLSPQKKRERRSKMLAIGLSVLLLAVGAIQGPKLMSQLSGPKTATVAAPAAETTPVTSALSGTTAEVPAAAAESGQLATFTTFAWRDPFKPQPSASGSSTGGSTSGATGSTSSTPPASGPSGKTTTTPESTPSSGSGETVTPATGETVGSGGQTESPTPPKPAPVIVFSLGQATTPVQKNAALISVNGHREVVTVGSAFPAKNPVFRLLSLRNGHVRISVIGGKFAGNALGLDLHKGTPIVLANKQHHLRFHLKLVKLTSVVQPALKTNTAPTSPMSVIAQLSDSSFESRHR